VGSVSVGYDAAAGTAADAWNFSPLSLFGESSGGAITYGGPIASPPSPTGTRTEQQNSLLNRVLNVIPGQPGASGQALCLATGGTWDPNAQACSGGAKSACDALPDPFNYVCQHPGRVAAGLGALALAWFAGPPIVAKIQQTRRAAAS
jgi:hypothetical protein